MKNAKCGRNFKNTNILSTSESCSCQIESKSWKAEGRINEGRHTATSTDEDNGAHQADSTQVHRRKGEALTCTPAVSSACSLVPQMQCLPACLFFTTRGVLSCGIHEVAPCAWPLTWVFNGRPPASSSPQRQPASPPPLPAVSRSPTASGVCLKVSFVR